MSYRNANYPIVRASEGEKTNPTLAALAADSGALQGGIYEVLVTAAQTALAEYSVQRRNAANGANVGVEMVIYGPANNTIAVPFRFEVEAGERVRVVMNAALTGDSVVTLTSQQVA